MDRLEEGDPYDSPLLLAPQGEQPPRLKPTKRHSRERGRVTGVEAAAEREVSSVK